MSGLTFEETVLESGCIENAQSICFFVREGCLKGDEIIELRLVIVKHQLLSGHAQE